MRYSGIVSVKWDGTDPLTSAQESLITAYQQTYNVKWVVVGTLSLSGLPGIAEAGSVISNEYFQVTLAPEFAQYGKYLNQSISANTKPTINWSSWQSTYCSLFPVSITDTSIVTPAIMVCVQKKKFPPKIRRFRNFFFP